MFKLGNLPTEHFQDDGAECTATVYPKCNILRVLLLSDKLEERVDTAVKHSPSWFRLQGVKERGCNTCKDKKTLRDTRTSLRLRSAPQARAQRMVNLTFFSTQTIKADVI